MIVILSKISKKELMLALEAYGNVCPPLASMQPDFLVTVKRDYEHIGIPFWDACRLAAKIIKDDIKAAKQDEMTEERAREILGEVINTNDGCYEFRGVLGMIHNRVMHIDVCQWSLDELKALVWWIENKS